MKIGKSLLAVILACAFYGLSESAHAQAGAVPTPTMTIQGQSVTLVSATPQPPYDACYDITPGIIQGYYFGPLHPSVPPSLCVKKETLLSRIDVTQLGIRPVTPLPPGFDPNFVLEVDWGYAGGLNYRIGAVEGGVFYRGFGMPASGNEVSLVVESPKTPPPPMDQGPDTEIISADPNFILDTGVSPDIPCRNRGTKEPCDDVQVTRLGATFHTVTPDPTKPEFLILPGSLSTVACVDEKTCEEFLTNRVAAEKELLQQPPEVLCSTCLEQTSSAATDCDGLCLRYWHVVLIVLVGVIVGIVVAVAMGRTRRA